MAMLSQTPSALPDRVRAWIDDDPDPASQAELTGLLARWPETEATLADRFAGRLAFGTAGLRGPLRAGPNGMNLAVVTAAAAGLLRWLADQRVAGPLVIGYDARYGSHDFAQRTAAVATGAGREALVLPGPLPTPVLAYAVRALGAAAGVMVTASHNPAGDNGYKVYLGSAGGELGDGAQIVPPVDAQIAAAIEAVGPLAKVALGPPGTVIPTEVLASYLTGAVTVVDPDGPRELTVAYTPMHGVGGALLSEAFALAGFDAPRIVAEQARPDPAFPTVAFPNPEEPGAMDRVIALAEAVRADLAIANDPDADRCAVAIPTDAGWRMLTGDELGILLADQLIRRGAGRMFATTIVSSSMLKALCNARHVPYGETLTGFKWIVRAGDISFGYEEALGYCVAPSLVRDKDGITAALLIAELAAAVKSLGHRLSDQLDALAAELGVHLTGQVAIRVSALSQITDTMARLRAQPPHQLDGHAALVTDRLPEADVLIIRNESARVVVRPSGTEPKLKAYLEVIRPVERDDVASARASATTALADLTAQVRQLLDPAMAAG